MGKYDTLASKSYICLEANPAEVFCKRTSDVGSPPEIVIDAIYWTDDQINQTMAWWKKLFLGIFGIIDPSVKQKEKQIIVPQEFIEITPYKSGSAENQKEEQTGEKKKEKKEKKPSFLPFALPPPFLFKKKEG